MRILAVLLAAACLTVSAQSTPALPGCDARPEVRQALDEKLAESALEKMTLAARLALRREVLEELIAKYPREIEPQRKLAEIILREDTARYPAMVESFRREAQQHPDDPLALDLAGMTLFNRDTPASIRFLEQALSKAPDFAWPALDLARVYSPGTKRANKEKSGQYIAAFFAACPSSTDTRAQRLLGESGGSELQKRVAAALRTRLQRETNPLRLMDYEVLWGLEFRIRPPQEHAAVRKQIDLDLKRIESANSKPDARCLVMLKNGYKQSGAPASTVTAMEDKLIETFPHSQEAYRIVSDRWEQAHKEPEDQADKTAWAKYHAVYREALKSWIERFTEAQELPSLWLYLVFENDMQPEEGLRVLDNYLAQFEGYPPHLNERLLAAAFLTYHKWQPQRVFELLRDSDVLLDQWDARFLGDNLSAEAEEEWRNNDVHQRQLAARYVLIAARLTEKPSEAARFKAFVERDLPPKQWEMIEIVYWQNRGRLAWLEERKADALIYYQKALYARKHPPQPSRGRIFDDLTEEARSLWQSLGGSETAYKMWSTRPAPNISEVAESGWKKPGKDLPAFELADLSGKTWRLKDLAGRAVLINVWATWCGPCQEELPKLEKLYEQVKQRSDLQILTLTIDEDLGAVAPFMKEKGYTFPVLPAYSFVTGLLDLVAIPQNWIVDGKGVWRWTGAPEGADAEWGQAMLKQIESARE